MQLHEAICYPCWCGKTKRGNKAKKKIKQ
jgi:hypothetical protein